MDFDQRLEKLVKRINRLRENVVALNKRVNQQNGKIVQSIADRISSVIGKREPELFSKWYR